MTRRHLSKYSVYKCAFGRSLYRPSRGTPFEAEILERLAPLIDKADVVAISDYGKGFLTKPLLKRINKRLLLYACLLLVPAVLFGLMLALAKR